MIILPMSIFMFFLINTMNDLTLNYIYLVFYLQGKRIPLVCSYNRSRKGGGAIKVLAILKGGLGETRFHPRDTTHSTVIIWVKK